MLARYCNRRCLLRAAVSDIGSQLAALVQAPLHVPLRSFSVNLCRFGWQQAPGITFGRSFHAGVKIPSLCGRRNRDSFGRTEL